ncbi:MAG: phosphoribosylamine--glycine ligase [Candidatus Omnitrophota bacterium]|nr:phosphoribosylamine--glycine ligase [Candidatus Omnitrophota bacterium]MBU1929346.1 phosphoribosylamine--glycine ligase [Candidatus Omnitrophota bacterium]MBU2035638.1 phosphoribosylamine--glycine ligase [Candidatus Omnitrophota bacterium]MBU2221448.1 phosphoribosylamine--glycine ligase [Candidatus Omnitrophota bacterium]MBU2258838.1 phosphoribosylamine--glycine ligase [Candidatus Omnitrophota bacterium]
MRILVIGSGGREHAIVWKIAQSKLAKKIFCAPGNGGIADIAECIPIKTDDISGLLEFAREEKIDLTVVGPEAVLANGIVDEFQKAGLKIFGPNKRAANLERSKVFSKELMAKYKVPTADFKVFDDPEDAKRYIEKKGSPCVVKADGLAQGKGVVVAKTVDEAKDALRMIMEDKVFGSAGDKVIIEECLEGEEASILVITDSKEVVALASAQDHKRVFNNDLGPNTGGMGAYSPAAIVTPGLFKEILEKIIYRTIDGLAKEGIEYKGVLYAGIMLTKDGPKTLEFNVRFGDPETQAILPRMKSDLLEVMLAVVEGKLSKISQFKWDERSCVCVVCASEGYPGAYQKDKKIFGLDQAAQIKDIVVFHSGTIRPAVHGQQSTAKYMTNGGRVLGVTGLGNTVKEAIDNTYQAVGKISFEGMHYRRDIGQKAVSSS